MLNATQRSEEGQGVTRAAGGSVRRAPGPDPTAPRPLVLLCDDEDAIRRMYRRALRTHDVDLADAADAAECLTVVAERHPELVVLDVTLPDRNGLEILPEIVASSPGSQVIVISGLVTDEVTAAALELGATACVQKVTFVPQLRALISKLAA